MRYFSCLSLRATLAFFAVVAATPLTAHAVPGDSPVSDRAADTAIDASATTTDATAPREVAKLKCPRYKVFYIDPSAQFFTPPVPIEDHAEFVFCSEHANLDEIRLKLKKMKPIRSQADTDAARIKVVLHGNDADAITFCSTGEITYKSKQYRLDRRAFEPALLSLREEGDRQRALAIETEDDGRDPASRDPASQRPAGRNSNAVKKP